MSRIVAVIACLVFIAPASAQSLKERTGVSAVLGIAPTTTDFINQAAISDMFGIEAGKLAIERGSDKTKSFAEKIVKDHEESSKALKALIQGGNVRASIPSSIDGLRQAILDKLTKLQGADFDREYYDTQVRVQADVLSLFERYSKGGDHPDLKLFAVKYLPNLEERVRLTKDLKN
jgi:putative membrane protein